MIISTPRRWPGLTAIALIAVFAAACGTAAATPSAGPTGGSSSDASAGSSVASATATTGAGPSDTPASASAGASTSAAAATPAPRAAWVHGQTVKQDVLVAAGVGWVLTTTNLWQTIDDGATWMSAYPHGLVAASIRGLGAMDANHAMLAAVNVGHSTSTYYMWHTSNGGLTWAYTALPPIAHDILTVPCPGGEFCGQPGDPQASFDYVDANTAFVSIVMRQGVDGLSNNIFETTNGGATWTAHSYVPALLPPSSPPPIRVQFSTPTIGVAESSNEISSTTTGWGHWTNQLLPTSDFSTPAISFLSSTYWAADEGLAYGTVHYMYALSSDQGASWVDHESDVPGISGLTGATVRVITPLIWIGTEQTSTSAGYTLGTATTIYTADGGVHWVMYGPQPFGGSVATFIDANHGWTGPNYQVATHNLYTTSDRGLTWHLITP